VAELYDNAAGVSPLWVPPWPSIEPSQFTDEARSLYGDGSDARLLAGIMGHNLCLDIFGSPSAQESESGVTAHGEASVNLYEITGSSERLEMKVTLPLAQLSFERTMELHGRRVRVREAVQNLTAMDRPLAWTQHVTLGPPFLDAESTEFRARVDRSMVSETDPGEHSGLVANTEFDWPFAPRIDGETADLRRMQAPIPASAYTAHRANPEYEHIFFTAFSPRYELALSYVWRRREFPWLGIWEENCSRRWSPWMSRTVARGMEFGLSPVPETRREMLTRKSLFETPMYGWLAANAQLCAEYWIVMQTVDRVPDDVAWP
jgi:hypothetical protein